MKKHMPRASAPVMASHLRRANPRYASLVSAASIISTSEVSANLNANNVREISKTTSKRKFFAADFLPEFNPETQIGIS
jgi:hypothetical protein